MSKRLSNKSVKVDRIYLLILVLVIAVGVISMLMFNKDDISGQAWNANDCSDALQMYSSLSWLTQCVQTRFVACPYTGAPAQAQLDSAAQSAYQSIGQPGYGTMYDCITSNNNYANLLGDKLAQQNSATSDKAAADAQLAAAVNRMSDAVNSLQGVPRPSRAWKNRWPNVLGGLVGAVNNRKWDDLIGLITNFNTYTNGRYGSIVSKIGEDATSAKSLDQRISDDNIIINNNNQLISYCVNLFQKIIDKVNSCQSAPAPAASPAPGVTSAPASVGASSSETVVIEAESYSSRSLTGAIDKENRCSGQVAAYIDKGAVLTFTNINVPSTGIYDIKYSIATPEVAGTIALVMDDTVRFISGRFGRSAIITGKGYTQTTDQTGTPYYYRLGYRQTGDWSVCDDSLDSRDNKAHTGAVGATDYPNGIQLSQGTHTLSFVNVGNAIGVDWIKLVPRAAPSNTTNSTG